MSRVFSRVWSPRPNLEHLRNQAKDLLREMKSALNLSRSRAEAVRESIIEFAKGKGIIIDKSQIQPVGVGIREPFVAKPANMEQAKQNMRVEFRVVRIPAEATKPADFDF